MNRSDFLFVKEAAKVLGVAPNTVRAWASAGKIDEYRHPVNNYRLFKKSDVDSLRRKIDYPIHPASSPTTRKRAK